MIFLELGLNPFPTRRDVEPASRLLLPPRRYRSQLQVLAVIGGLLLLLPCVMSHNVRSDMVLDSTSVIFDLVDCLAKLGAGAKKTCLQPADWMPFPRGLCKGRGDTS